MGQNDTHAWSRAIANLEERSEVVKSTLDSIQGHVVDVRHQQKGVAEVESKISVSIEDLRKETVERRTETSQLAGRIRENADMMERAEQKWIKAESTLQQELVNTKAGVKKEVRERELMEARLGVMIRDEAFRREEAIEKESRARKETEERNVESLQATLRDERRLREKELLRLEDRSLGGGKAGLAAITDRGQAGSSPDHFRGMKQSVLDLQDRLTAAELRQKSAEERTVSMLDAIMSGLTGPARH